MQFVFFCEEKKLRGRPGFEAKQGVGDSGTRSMARFRGSNDIMW